MSFTPLKPAMVAALVAAALAGCSPQDTLEVFSGPTMGSTYSIKYVRTAKTPELSVLQRETENILAELDRQLSNYRPDSSIQKFNALSAQECQTMPELLLGLVAAGEQLSVETEGALDLTIQPVLELWGFGPKQGRRVPSAEEIEQAKQQTGHQYLHVKGSELCKDIALKVDFNSIAAGYAVDLVAARLEALGVQSYLVEITGELTAKGRKPDGSEWRIALEAPKDDAREAMEVIRLDGYSISTSGDYRNYFEEQGRRYSHTIDPRLGAPIQHRLAAVTVADVSAMRADGLSTALMVMGPEQGLAFAEQKGIAALFVSRQEQGFSSQSTKSFDQLFGKERQP